MSNWGPILVAAVFLLGIFAMGSALYVWEYRAKRSNRRNPLSTNLLRSPGETLRNQIDDLRFDVATFMALGMTAWPVVIAAYLVHWVSMGKAPAPIVTGFFVVLGISAQGFLIWKFWRSFSRLRLLRLGYEAEVAVGQALAEVARNGYRVFHDFPADDGRFNIDHIVVGPSGVYAIETKGRSKPYDHRSEKAEYKVSYDGESLLFPDHFEKEPLTQAKANADYLRKLLTAALGERVEVQPVLVLPGWFVRTTNPAAPITVLATRQLEHFFASRRRIMLGDKEIQQIAHQLDQRCRNVAPRAYAAAKADKQFATNTGS